MYYNDTLNSNFFGGISDFEIVKVHCNYMEYIYIMEYTVCIIMYIGGHSIIGPPSLVIRCLISLTSMCALY